MISPAEAACPGSPAGAGEGAAGGGVWGAEPILGCVPRWPGSLFLSARTTPGYGTM